VTPLLRVAYAVTEAILGTPVAVPALLSAGAAGGDPAWKIMSLIPWEADA